MCGCMGVPHAGVYGKLTLKSTPTHMVHGQPYARVELNSLPESALSPSQGLRILASDMSAAKCFQHKSVRECIGRGPL